MCIIIAELPREGLHEIKKKKGMSNEGIGRRSTLTKSWFGL